MFSISLLSKAMKDPAFRERLAPRLQDLGSSLGAIGRGDWAGAGEAGMRNAVRGFRDWRANRQPQLGGAWNRQSLPGSNISAPELGGGAPPGISAGPPIEGLAQPPAMPFNPQIGGARPPAMPPPGGAAPVGAARPPGIGAGRGGLLQSSFGSGWGG